MPKPTRSIKIVMKMMINGDRLFAICCERPFEFVIIRTHSCNSWLTYLKYLKSAAHQISLESNIALLARQSARQNRANASVIPGEHYHRVSEYMTNESTVIKMRQAIRRMLQFLTERVAPHRVITFCRAIINIR